MNPFENNIKSLMDVYGSWNPMAYIQGHKQLDSANQWNQNQLKQEQQKVSYNEEINPLKIQQQKLANQTAEAELPGIHLKNMDDALNVDKKARTHSSEIDDILKTHKSKNSKRDLDEITQAGEAFRQGAQYMRSIPAPLRKEFGKRILGKYWQPEFDNFGDDYLVQMMAQIGNDMGEASSKYQQQLRLQNDEQAFKEAENKKKLDAQERIAQFRATIQSKLAEHKQQGRNPKTYQEISVRLWQEAQNISDPDQKAIVLQQAQEFAQLYQTSIMLRAQATNAGKVDMGGVSGLPTMPSPAPGNVPGVAPSVDLGPTQAPGKAKTEQEAFVKAFGKYEPEKYDYRIGPEGKPQRKLKGQ